MQIEQCGTGFPYCQIIDSIFGDVQMSKVKPSAKQEYEYLNNFKVLQAAFKNHGIDKPIPVERLVKCKVSQHLPWLVATRHSSQPCQMQDNLEFCQWMKKYWDLNYPGGEYDAIARRKGQGVAPSVSAAPAPGTSCVDSRLMKRKLTVGNQKHALRLRLLLHARLRRQARDGQHLRQLLRQSAVQAQVPGPLPEQALLQGRTPLRTLRWKRCAARWKR